VRSNLILICLAGFLALGAGDQRIPSPVALFIQNDYQTHPPRRHKGRWKMDVSVAELRARSVEKWCAAFGVDLAWKMGLNSAENHWNRMTDDGRHPPSVGAQQMQVATAQLMADELHLDIEVTAPMLVASFDLEERLSCHYLRNLLDEFKGDYRKAVRAYNAGDDKVRRGVKIWNFKHTKKEPAGLTHLKRTEKARAEFLEFVDRPFP
jgi:hypothetical protein